MFIPRQTLWTQQPQQAVGIDWSNPITRGLVTCFNGASSMIRDETGTALSPSGNLLRRIGKDGIGYGNASSGASGVIVLPSTDRNRLVGANGTIFHVTGWTSALTAAEAIWAVRDTVTQVSQLAYASNSINLVLNNTNHSFATTVGNYSRLAARLTNASSIDYFGNGALLGTVATTQSFVTSSIAPSLFNRIGGARAHTGNTSILLTWNRALSDSEIRSISQNPWQIFKRPSLEIFIPLAASSGTTSVSSDLSASYNVTGSVSADATAAYSIRSAVFADASASYAVRASAQADRSAAYAIRSAVISDLASSYAIQTAGTVTSGLDAAYNVRTAATADISVGYAIRAAVQAEIAAAYALRTAVQRDLAGSYAISAGLSSVSATLTAAYAVEGSLYTRAPSGSGATLRAPDSGRPANIQTTGRRANLGGRR